MLKAKHERFAQLIAQGKTATDAYEIAGYKRNDGNACKLAAKPEVQARIKEITGEAAARAVVTVQSLIEEAEAARLLAMEIENPSAAVSAIKEKGILSGKRVERAEHGRAGEFADIDAMNADELSRYIVEQAEAAGLRHITAPRGLGEGKPRKLTH